ncbi:MAG: hypothetical protein R3F30_14550 [Planctomycetota bacterium]
MRSQGNANPLLLAVLAGIVLVGGYLLLDPLGDPRVPKDKRGEAATGQADPAATPGAKEGPASPEAGPENGTGPGDPTKAGGTGPVGTEVGKTTPVTSAEREAWNRREAQLMDTSHDPAIGAGPKRRVLEELQASKYGKVHVPGEVDRLLDEVPSQELLRELMDFMGKHPDDQYPLMLTKAYSKASDKETRLAFFKAIENYPGNSYLLDVLNKFERTVDDTEIHEAIVRAREKIYRD